ncbi:competence type IV pilus minor pilin ComGF [Limosilactobacillus mucosae]|uniref:competence type IV pilus minor pilin ComGF n=1 Tax=Limosilactobacillus mucosae TaxID=97478 RepID=UPI00233E9E5A|nr:competence type IV pilus minor pilin ComGF [Limosilactobacillus mucosae]MDC2845774.1 competence type IV pilus minor pilin ComGF [Limosilactobacillus mucosae]
MKKAAFTLAESLMALLISMFAIIVLGQVVKTTEKIDQRSLDMPTDWYLFVTELESSDRQFTLCHCQDRQHVVLYGAATDKYYELVAENDRIYLRLQHGGGYLPMLYQIKEANFSQLSKRRLKMEVKRSNDQRQTAIISLAPSPEQHAFSSDDRNGTYSCDNSDTVSLPSQSGKTHSSFK